MEFSFDFYKKILLELKENFEFKFFEEYQESGAVYLRHDVDIFPENILNFLKIEKEAGIKSVFFLQPDSRFYNILDREMKTLIKIITENGFEVSLHIDASDYESLEQLQSEVYRQFDFFSKYYSLSKVISFHRPPEKLLNNVQIPGFINTYEDSFFKKIRYFSDSNRRNFYGALKESLNKNTSTSIQLVLHPYWWDFEHLDIQSLFSRTEICRTQKNKTSLSSETKIYNQFFNQRMV
jgi:hypothetical protein